MVRRRHSLLHIKGKIVEYKLIAMNLYYRLDLPFFIRLYKYKRVGDFRKNRKLIWVSYYTFLSFRKLGNLLGFLLYVFWYPNARKPKGFSMK